MMRQTDIVFFSPFNLLYVIESVHSSSEYLWSNYFPSTTLGTGDAVVPATAELTFLVADIDTNGHLNRKIG